MNIYINNEQDELEINKTLEKIIKRVVEEALKEEERSLDTEVSISFVDDFKIRNLNREYRNQDKSTDVLSFPIEMEFLLPIPILGDIIISTETAIRQAKEYNHSIYRELTYLLTHSMFHLMGYNHIEAKDKKVMRFKENLVLNRLNIDRSFKGE